MRDRPTDARRVAPFERSSLAEALAATGAVLAARGDEAARAMEHLSLKDVVGLLASHTAPLAGRALQQLTPDLASDVLAALEPDAAVEIGVIIGKYYQAAN